MVKRYGPDISCGPPCVGVMDEHPRGDYVLFDDYQDLLDKYETFKNRMAHVTELIGDLYREV